MDFRLPNPSSLLKTSNRCIDFYERFGKGFLVLLFSSEKWPETKKTHGCQKVPLWPRSIRSTISVTAFVIETCMYTKYPDPLLHTTPFTGIHYSALVKPFTMLHKLVPTLD